MVMFGYMVTQYVDLIKNYLYKEGISLKMLLENIFNPIVDDAHSSQSSINFSRCNIMTPWLHFSKYISHLSEAKVKYFIIQNSNLSVAHE